MIGGGQTLKNSAVFTEIESDVSAEIGNSNDFSAQIHVISKKKKKKKRSSPEIKSDFSAEIGKFERFFRPNSGDLQKKKKKKVFTEIESDFSAEIGNSNDFSAQIQVISKKKKKKVFTEIEINYWYVRNYWKKTATKHRQAMLS